MNLLYVNLILIISASYQPFNQINLIKMDYSIGLNSSII